MTTPISRRALITAAAGLTVPSALAGIASANSAHAGPRVERIDFATAATARPQAVDPRTRARTLSTGELKSPPFRLAAVTWTGPDSVTVRVRVRTRRGWSAWLALPGDHHDADPDTAEAAMSRSGTVPAVVPPSDAVEVQVTAGGAVPADLTIELIDPGSAVAQPTTPLSQSIDRPRIRRRSAWGADESLRESGDPLYRQVRGAFVHHTAGANGYSEGDVPSIIRGIYAYHVVSRGWRDIGYNFVIDKFGRIWEGRYGGIAKAVVGAHARGYNFYAFGASVLGTYSGNRPTSETLRAFAELIAWKFQVHDVDPTKVSYPELTDVPAIAGHRDGGATACPGDRLYDKLGVIRGGVANLLS